MNMRPISVWLALSLSCCSLCPQIVRAQQTLGSIERTTPEMNQLVGKDAKIEVLARGFTWTEGPVWVGGRVWRRVWRRRGGRHLGLGPTWGR